MFILYSAPFCPHVVAQTIQPSRNQWPRLWPALAFKIHVFSMVQSRRKFLTSQPQSAAKLQQRLLCTESGPCDQANSSAPRLYSTAAVRFSPSDRHAAPSPGFIGRQRNGSWRRRALTITNTAHVFVARFSAPRKRSRVQYISDAQQRVFQPFFVIREINVKNILKTKNDIMNIEFDKPCAFGVLDHL